MSTPASQILSTPPAAANPDPGAAPASSPGSPPPGQTSPGQAPAPGLPGQGQTPSGWWDTFKDPATKEFAANKKYESPEMLANSYKNLETLYGAEKAGRTIMTPKDDADVEGWKAIGAKLGVPENPADYKLPVPEGEDPAFSLEMSGLMKESNIPPVLARQLAEKWNAKMAAVTAAAKQAADADMSALKGEWGPKYQENEAIAKQGFAAFAEKFGIKGDDAAVRAEAAFGTANFMKMFHGWGLANSEAGFAGSGKDPGAIGGSDTKGGAAPLNASRAMEEINSITDKRAAGTINDWDWKNTFEPRMRELEKAVTGGS